jgi:hypothetical protein
VRRVFLLDEITSLRFLLTLGYLVMLISEKVETFF